MAFSVTRTSRGLVAPFEQTPSATLDLSIIDRLPVLRCNARTLHVFRHGPEAARVIREALSKALVPYYPLAGRLKESSQGHLQIECSGEGVWLVEASASCNLDSVDYFDSVESIPCDELLPDYVPETPGIEPLVQMQVTQFACEGFVIGLIFCHSICDGLGAAQFLNAVGELARGLEHLSISPVWCRDFSPPPSQQANITKLPILPPPMPSYRLEHANIDISMDQISQLKKQYFESTGRICSSFEVVAATFWRQRTVAINFKPSTEVKLVFFANCRQVLDPPLPKGFYGNCFFPVTITASTESLAQASDIEVVKLIQESKAKLPIEFGNYIKGEYLKDGEDPFAPPLVYTTLFISEWGRLGFNQVDYGWGPPVHIVPIQGSSIIPVGIVGSLPLPRKGICLMTWCVEEVHRQEFIHQMMKST
ncbi:acyl transferase 4 [Ricinus communis]|uniref:10-deacetylbaccatin III 10-O-acetyltransferase, putative n=1 Tax=Ricinus communis TaxID=3988 RepID=B9RN49_RICCO|nr:acyl transferase 4 [Ricinus communis]EEF47172.1 10-deacetylbaccatin III 10-O-acetyltransferase, putative [Ricinus communis]|eukprot:XP_002515188.1 acyl transferase 4 [Ricinus communis]